MQVRIVERRRDEFTRSVYLDLTVVLAYAGYPVAANGNVALDEPAAEHVGDGRVLYNYIGFYPARRNVYQFFH